MSFLPWYSLARTVLSFVVPCAQWKDQGDWKTTHNRGRLSWGHSPQTEHNQVPQTRQDAPKALKDAEMADFTARSLLVMLEKVMVIGRGSWWLERGKCCISLQKAQEGTFRDLKTGQIDIRPKKDCTANPPGTHFQVHEWPEDDWEQPTWIHQWGGKKKKNQPDCFSAEKWWKQGQSFWKSLQQHNCKQWYVAASGEAQIGHQEGVPHWQGSQSLEQATQGSNQATRPVRAHGAPERHLDMWFSFRQSWEEPGFGLNDPYESLPTWNILQFHDL